MRFYVRQRADPCFVIMLGEALAKAGPYIGPRGGKWADAKHTVPWDAKKHGRPKQLGLFEKPKARPVEPALVLPDPQVDPARVAAYAAKQEAKQERLKERAEKKRAEAKARFKGADLREEVSGIPMGQPILVGHHSEKRHRRAIERSWANLGRGVEAEKEATDLERRAAAMETSRVVSSDDPEAVVKLREKVAEAEKQREAYKKVNRLVRKKGMTPEKLAAEMGWKVETAQNAMEPDEMGRRGFPSYLLTNLGANIRRMKARVDQLKKEATTVEAAPVVGEGYRVEESKEDNRIRFTFDKRPDKETHKKMRSAGFVFSRTTGAYQRKLNNAGRYAAKRMAKELFSPEETEKSERFVFVDPLLKAGPFIGPRGGKWQDPKHTIPWKPEAIPGKGKEPGQ